MGPGVLLCGGLRVIRFCVLGVVFLCFQSAWSEDTPQEGSNPAWVVQFAVAQETPPPNGKIDLAEELEHARATFEKLAEKTAFRRFQFHKQELIEDSISGKHRVQFNEDLFMDFELESRQEEHILHAVWLRKESSPEEKFTQVGGNVKKPYSPGKSLVILGPKVEEGVGVAIIRLETERGKD